MCEMLWIKFIHLIIKWPELRKATDMHAQKHLLAKQN